MGCKNVMFKHKCGSLAFAGCANGVRITISGYDYEAFICLARVQWCLTLFVWNSQHQHVD